MESVNYWGFRVNSRNIKAVEYLRKEIELGRLRQGWGYSEDQDLRNPNLIDSGARRNIPMYNKVKAGDIILVPHMPSWSYVSVLRATKDWNEGYNYDYSEMGDYGHIFPVEKLLEFDRSSDVVSGYIKSSLKNYGRFWNMNKYQKDIDLLLIQDKERLRTASRADERFKMAASDAFQSVFQMDSFSDCLYEKLTHCLTASEWEFALVEGLKILYPEPYFIVTKTGGVTEKMHGCDITIQIPGLGGKHYLIAIQVKDYSGIISEYAEKQVSKSDYFETTDSDCIVIDKIVIVTHASKKQHSHLIKKTNGVRYLFEEDTKELCSQLAFAYLTKNPFSGI